MKAKTTALSVLVLLAVATVMPACDIQRGCNPEVEYCPYTGAHPSTLAPKQVPITSSNVND